MEGGSDTTSSIVIAFVHAMTKWGDVLKKAQKEIDAVMGEERTPVWDDYEKLPYVGQIVKEAMRWRPVVPLAFPHALTEGTAFLAARPLVHAAYQRSTSRALLLFLTNTFQTTGSTATSSPKARLLSSTRGACTMIPSASLTLMYSIRITTRAAPLLLLN